MYIVMVHITHPAVSYTHLDVYKRQIYNTLEKRHTVDFFSAILASKKLLIDSRNANKALHVLLTYSSFVCGIE